MKTNGFVFFYRLKNFAGDLGVLKSAGGSGITEYVAKQFDQTITWDDVVWLVKYDTILIYIGFILTETIFRFTKLPVILKGILTKEDALLAVKTGCKGIIVSNHGARQLDTVQATVSNFFNYIQRFLICWLKNSD